MSGLLDMLLASYSIIALLAYFLGYSHGYDSRQDEIDRINDELDAKSQ